MSTIHFHEPTKLTPEQYIAGLIDFGPGRRRVNIREQPLGPMTSENVDEFEIRILDSHYLVVSIVLVHAPWSVTAEEYQIS